MVFRLGSTFRFHAQVIVTLRFSSETYSTRFSTLAFTHITHDLPLIYIPVMYFVLLPCRHVTFASR